jgi:membrane protease subunit (stomatin/prohibitin family)
VGGAAYHAGKRGQQSRDQEADQTAQIADLQQQQAQPAAPAPVAAAPAPAGDEDPMAKLTQLKSLLDQGILTQAEFDFQKTKILQSM